MSTDLIEDHKDSREIRKQKEEQKRSGEAMSKWKSGKGIVENRDDKNNVRN